ncbi:MAG: type III-A CRISPR-associated RAMP protein Csm5 [Bacteroidetes bacterium]|jgi:CRISPR-associated protein Csm5|nr:type III-A CRISPR-associated RAMP protein Csm5 [Bacteroidota bacterium]MBT6686026.1 type III-A CRISPR-associated RAMP protein Csm5 [Bacteroidota bacterium]MBT7144535.1 type III-A CRISPR-associated RAMP protein Csm5 [Bacteroidota bacterium]MBT7492702.1 type III-A CRISPR-associated RAMP protein Csm5 [Bacteroidota bacterium]
MPKIKIETLTPIHIGSGNDLSADIDFLFFEEKNEDNEFEEIIAVVDDEKILKIIGEENINIWAKIIENRKDFFEYLKQRKHDITSADIKKRIIRVYGSQTSTLKEQMLDGKQIPYIPGSSIKGAIRTAVLANKALANKKMAKKNLRDNRDKFSADKIEKKLFGNSANEDVFRFLQVGDAYFDYETIAINAKTLNLIGNGWKFKHDNQLVECISEDSETFFNLKINNELIEKHNEKKIWLSDTDFLTFENLFSTIKNHTLQLLKKELQFWSEENVKEDVFDNYIEKLHSLIDVGKKCRENEAIIRIGYGSGWNFITGAWAKDEAIMSDFEYDSFKKFARRKKYADQIPFPKTRKIDQNGDILGFAKLTF